MRDPIVNEQSRERFNVIELQLPITEHELMVAENLLRKRI